MIFTFLFKKKKKSAYAISNRLTKYILASPLTFRGTPEGWRQLHEHSQKAFALQQRTDAMQIVVSLTFLRQFDW